MRSDLLTTMIKYYSLAQSTPIVQYTTRYNQSSVMHTTYWSARSSLWRSHHQSKSLNSAVTSLLITKMRVANADIQDNSLINSDCSTPVTQIQDYGERKEENNTRCKLQGYTLQVPKWNIHSISILVVWWTFRLAQQSNQEEQFPTETEITKRIWIRTSLHVSLD